MSTWKGGFKFEEALRTISKKVGSGATMLQVGYFPDAEYPDGTKVALVAAIHNFGAPARNIPPRPFFTNFIKDGQKEWPKVIAGSLKATRYDVPAALALVGEELKGELQQSIMNTNDPPLQPETIRRKGHAKPLVGKYGFLYNKIAAKVKVK